MSAWGRYCCGGMKRVRVAKQVMLAVVVACALTVWITNWQAGIAIEPGVMGQVVVPVSVFAFKKLCFFFDITVQMHDTPYKGHSYLLAAVDGLLSFNIGISTASVGVRRWLDTFTYIGMDWTIFFLRIGVLGRVGMKQCPKLVSYYVAKQIENIPSPLPNNITAVGSKTAMVTTQAYLCLVEGETMTSNYALHVIVFVFRWYGLQDNDMSLVFPLRSMGVIALFTGLDLIQDFGADRLTAKFSGWTWIYTNAGLYHKKNWAWLVVIGFSMGAQYTLLNGKIARMQFHRVTRLPVCHNADWTWSPSGNIHY